MTTPVDCVKYLCGDEAEAFCEWAWGPKYIVINFLGGTEAVHVWNKRHGDKLQLSSSGKVSMDLPKMIAIWKEEKCDVRM